MGHPIEMFLEFADLCDVVKGRRLIGMSAIKLTEEIDSSLEEGNFVSAYLVLDDFKVIQVSSGQAYNDEYSLYFCLLKEEEYKAVLLDLVSVERLVEYHRVIGKRIMGICEKRDGLNVVTMGVKIEGEVTMYLVSGEFLFNGLGFNLSIQNESVLIFDSLSSTKAHKIPLC